MRNVIAAVVFATVLAGCDLFNSMKELFKHSTAASSALEAELGLKPHVGFNWHNGRLTSVTVQFPDLYDKKPLSELAEQARAVVVKEFQRKPDMFVLAFQVPQAAK